MNPLETRIYSLAPKIKESTLKAMMISKPFQYMINLAKVGEETYGVPANESFWYGCNKSLDWYNNHKKYSNNLGTEFYALKQGAEHLMRYCYYNMVVDED